MPSSACPCRRASRPRRSRTGVGKGIPARRPAGRGALRRSKLNIYAAADPKRGDHVKVRLLRSLNGPTTVEVKFAADAYTAAYITLAIGAFFTFSFACGAAWNYKDDRELASKGLESQLELVS
jgi:hypothetical protein